LSSWLAPAWEVLPKAGNGNGGSKPSLYPGRGADRLELRPDLDQIEALSGEREALWARVDAKHRHSDACEHRSAMTRRWAS